jgi:head-tail adaptor
MKRPHLNRRLVLETPVRIADGAGGFRETWDALGEIWAEVIPRRGREATSGGLSISRTGFAITLRAAPSGSVERPQPYQRFREGSRVFSIQAVTECDPQGRYLTCQAQEEVAV